MRGPDEKRTERARALRQQDNTAESWLWNALRNRQMNGWKFVRQMPLGPYFADFACRELMLVVELDGNQHVDSRDDEVRNQSMNDAGWSVARFWSGDMLGSPETVLDTISAICDGRIFEFVTSYEFRFYPARSEGMATQDAPHPNPLPVNGERETTFMRRAIALARPGKTWPNPSVGCVLVKDGVIIAEGTTGDDGRPHAEEVALDAAGEAARGATAYVTLEPCGNRSLPRPSCSERLIAAGVVEVVYACADPSPLASHLGPQRMIDAGVSVQEGLLADEADHLIAPTRHVYRTGRAMVTSAIDPAGFDAEFIADPTADLAAELAAWAAKGYRSLWVAVGSELALRLADQGLLTE